MNRTAFFLSLLLTVAMLEWTNAPPKGAIAHESSNYIEFSSYLTHGKGSHITALQ